MKEELKESRKLQKAAGILKEDYQEDPTIHKKSNMKEDTQKQTAIEYLKDLASKGELLPQDIRDIADQLVKARRVYTTSKRSPESYKNAAVKAKATRIKSKADQEKRDRAADREDAKNKKRKEAGLAPLEVTIFTGYAKPAHKNIKQYYNIVNTIGTGEPGNTRIDLELKPEWRNKPFAASKQFWTLGYL